MRTIENETPIGPWLLESSDSSDVSTVVAQYHKFVEDEDDEDKEEAVAKGANSRGDIRDESTEFISDTYIYGGYEYIW